ncbi:MAG: DEAD/DEAH box helicase family protein, partial [Kiritimatiellae bacterium]|nr:DEAD/DEAH box helicase family protein [Kiritimatiellia bacterium]
MNYNEEETRFHLIDPLLRSKGYNDPLWIKMETPAPVDPIGTKGRRRKGSGRTDYLLCVQADGMPRPLPVAVIEAKKEGADPLEGMQQAKGYADCKRFDIKYVYATNGHLYGEYNGFTRLQTGAHPLKDFPSHRELTSSYAKAMGIDLSAPDSKMLFMADSPAWSQSRYYQDAAIRAAFEKIIRCRNEGIQPRVLLSLATGSGKTIIATNLLWRLHQAEHLPKPALFICDRDELRGQAYNKLKAAFGDNVRVVQSVRGQNAARNARIHIATYQTLGLDDDAQDFACFLTEHYEEDAFSVIIIDECHRSAWGRWSEVLERNPNAIHIGLTATPRQLHESENATVEDREITSNNFLYFGEPVYEYTLVEAQEDGYLAACEIVKRKANIDNCIFTRDDILAAKAVNIRTGALLTTDDLPKEQYTGKDFDDKLFIELRTPAMCEDLFQQLCLNGGPEQKVIIFCTREIHADRVAMRMNNLYTKWCTKHGKEQTDLYAFKCMGGANKGADFIEPMRGSGSRAFIACTVDLLEAGVDIERLNAVVFFRYLESSIKFYQMVGRGTRIHEETKKYKFWLYDYTDVTRLFGTDFITPPPRSGGGSGGDDGGERPEPPELSPTVAEMGGQSVKVHGEGRFIVISRDGRDSFITTEEYRSRVVKRVLSEAYSIEEFRQLWIEQKRRRALIEHLLAEHYNPEIVRDFENMGGYDLYDVFGHFG